jgi:hypothetical protein
LVPFVVALVWLGTYWAFDGFSSLLGGGLVVTTAYVVLMYPVYGRPPLSDHLSPLWLRVRNGISGLILRREMAP